MENIREAKTSDIPVLADMYRSMFKETVNEQVKDHIGIYEVMAHIDIMNPHRHVIVYDDGEIKGFAVIEEEQDLCFKDEHRRNSILRAFVNYPYRNSKVYKTMYDYVISKFDNLIGFTEINSPHIKILDKRHECVGKVYKMKRNENGGS